MFPISPCLLCAVVCIGAGFCGIFAVIRYEYSCFAQKMPNVDLTVYENGIYGTWSRLINKYPFLTLNTKRVQGLACDIPSHSCLHRSHRTTSTNMASRTTLTGQAPSASGPGILAYLNRVVGKYKRGPPGIQYVAVLRSRVKLIENYVHSKTWIREPLCVHKLLELIGRDTRSTDFLPQFAVLCRRLTDGPGYLEASCAENTMFKTVPMAYVTPTGINLEDGHTQDMEGLMRATSFDVSYRFLFTVLGRRGMSLNTC
ncbi:hypothetical protein BJV78DRAFT_1157760 [Lactifluus subvellereus]|nr:hypothetical protein BJV78DRAFT_1157760 [Lactifluus subvellereus]